MEEEARWRRASRSLELGDVGGRAARDRRRCFAAAAAFADTAAGASALTPCKELIMSSPIVIEGHVH